jgi:hypothetical protein
MTDSEMFKAMLDRAGSDGWSRAETATFASTLFHDRESEITELAADYVESYYKDTIIARVEDELRWISVTELPRSPGEHRAKGPALVMVDRTIRWPNYRYMTPAQVARLFSEIRVVYHASSHRDKVGTYSSGGSAYRIHWYVRAVDTRTRCVTAETELIGGPPPHKVIGHPGVAGEGSAPFPGDVEMWASKLPYK